MGIEQDANGSYYNISNRAGCWGNDTGYVYSRYRADNPYMLNNAEKIFDILHNFGWSNNAICAVIGNMCGECSLNAGQTQIGYDIGGKSGGYGLVMWTPQTKYTNWARSENHGQYIAYWQLWFIDNKPTQEEQNQFTPKFEYDYISWDDFIHDSTHTVEWLTNCFFDCYEKGNPAKANMPYRRYCANWYATYFYDYVPTEPIIPDPAPFRGRKVKMPLWMELIRRRLMLNDIYTY